MSLNVRLGAEEARMAAALREAGVPISALVRDAIRAEYERRIARPSTARLPSQIMADILAALPDPADLAPRSFASNDRRAVTAHIAAKLARRRG